MSYRTIAPPETRTSAVLRICIVLAGLTGAAGVVLMALAAHADSSGLVRTAAEMLLFHAPALLAVGVLAQTRRIPLLPVALILMIAGLTLFCGDLIVRASTEQRLFPMAAPTGGMLLIAGWVGLALSAVRIRSRRD